MLPSDAGLSWVVVSAGTKLVLMAWLLRWQQDVGTHHWSMAHEQLGLRPPPGRWGGVGIIHNGTLYFNSTPLQDSALPAGPSNNAHAWP